ncbi:MAG: hypothetical protein KME07_12430 [Pegethrix bostrychoides GSE-TBD4-15B]|jgi:hypothetical protein|uniref:Winged helix domain-containing protein n=1 Tax=Pegethrix bostrychoides GSE-TBD4-15B TaxID=2839662 RepID=A0A951PAT9_9CYAN|nr:hypothetical protein [Pegethrix bostrychoides GSE-TBD4-15B]
MPAEQADGFADNWAYLRTELHWLDRLLMAAAAKQRKEAKEIDRIAQSKADQATSHWWKGLITAEGNAAYDEYRQPSSAKIGYQAQLEAQIQAARRQGVLLGLPSLCERLGLTPFEKNLVLMSLAPEVNRRYARLYRFLQGEEESQSDLPTLDLALRLLCKSDQEWRQARQGLVGNSLLLRHKLVQMLPGSTQSLLNAPLKLSESMVNYLLAEQPTAQVLEDLLTSHGVAGLVPQVRVVSRNASLQWLQQKPLPQNLPALAATLPESTLAVLQGMEQRVQGYQKAMQQWQLSAKTLAPPGLLALLVGMHEADKLLAAAILADALQKPLLQVDLAQLDPLQAADLLKEIKAAAPSVLLIQSAELWLKRSSFLSALLLHQFWAERRRLPAITLFSVTQPAAVQLCWQKQIDRSILFKSPDAATRIQIWQQAFPAAVPLSAEINWPGLAELPLERAEILAMAQESLAYAAAEASETVGLDHILYTLAQHNWNVEVKPIKTKKRSRKKTSGEGQE